MPSSPPSPPQRVVVVGGGIAALEAVLALHDLAGPRVHVTLVAPRPDFSLRALSVTIPFGAPVARSLALDDVLQEHGGAFVQDAVLSVEPERHAVLLASGRELPYDALVLAPGARPVPTFGVGLTFDPYAADTLSGVVRDLEEGWSRSVAFVVPPGVTWALPLYELALMTAERVAGMGIDDAALHLVTPEARPLRIFGHAASEAVERLLAAARITFHGATDAQVPAAGHVDLGLEGELAVDRIVALPRLLGPDLLGVPADGDGFVLIDELCRVPGLDDVWAVGDATQQPVKQGGLACAQADAVAAQIAAAAGADAVVGPPVLVLRGRLLAGREERFLHRPLGTARSEAGATPLWWPPAKVASRYLAPYLEAHGVAAPAPRTPRDSRAVTVDLPVDCTQAPREAVLGLAP